MRKNSYSKKIKFILTWIIFEQTWLLGETFSHEVQWLMTQGHILTMYSLSTTWWKTTTSLADPEPVFKATPCFVNRSGFGFSQCWSLWKYSTLPKLSGLSILGVLMTLQSSTRISRVPQSSWKILVSIEKKHILENYNHEIVRFAIRKNHNTKGTLKKNKKCGFFPH